MVEGLQAYKRIMGDLESIKSVSQHYHHPPDRETHTSTPTWSTEPRPYGCVLVSQTYTIPNSPEWPENVRGMPLGQKLTYIKSRSNILTEYPERRDELLRMGTYYPIHNTRTAYNHT